MELKESAQDNGWYDRGELPPVGAECEWSQNGSSWEECVIIFYYMNTLVLDHLKHRGNVRLLKTEQMQFRPIKSEREKAIDEIHAVIDSRLDSVLDTVISGKRQIAEALYDAGLRFKD